MPAGPWEAGDLYEPYVGRWSRLVAVQFLDWLSIPPDRDWLDVGCGTGAMTQTILDRAEPRSVRGVEPSPFIERAQRVIDDPRASFHQAGAESLPLDDDSIDVAVSGLVLNFVPDQRRALDEMKRVARAGGTIAAYVWDYAGKMELMRYFWDAATHLDPDAASLDEGPRFPLCRPEALAQLFADLREVQTRAIDVATCFRDFDDYWAPFLGGQGPAPGYAMSLTEQARNRLRDEIRSRLPVAPDGTISLIARAWAVRGSVTAD